MPAGLLSHKHLAQLQDPPEPDYSTVDQEEETMYFQVCVLPPATCRCSQLAGVVQIGCHALETSL